jgi:hypothetical protein
MIGFLKELWEFSIARKKLWLFPIVVLMALFGGIIILTHGSALSPFIYAIF